MPTYAPRRAFGLPGAGGSSGGPADFGRPQNPLRHGPRPAPPPFPGQSPNPNAPPPGRPQTPAPPPGPPFGANYAPGMFPNLSPEAGMNMLNQMAANPNRAGELMNLLLTAQYGQGVPLSGVFGDYLRQQAGTIGAITQLADALGFNIGSRGGPYAQFEDVYEGLGGHGPGTPGINIGQWRNAIYGGAGAFVPGGILSGSARARAMEPGDLSGARSYLEGNIRPLLGSTMTDTGWGTLMNLLPNLFTDYTQQTAGVTGAPLWAQWLQSQGYLPGQAF